MRKMYKRILAYGLIFGVIGCGAAVEKEENMRVADSYYKMGMAYINTENDHISYKNFEKALELEPDNAQYIYSMGLFYLKRKTDDKAEEYLLKAISLDPEKAEFRNSYAVLLVRKGEPDKAIENWKKAAEDPNYAHHIMVYYNIAKTLFDEQRYEQIEEYINKAFAINRLFSQGYDLLYAAYLRTGEYVKAEELLKKNIVYSQGSLKSKFRLGQFYYDRGRYSDAVPILEEVYDKDPESPHGKEAKKIMIKLGLIYE